MLTSGKAEYESRSKEHLMLEFIEAERFDNMPSPRIINSHLSLRYLLLRILIMFILGLLFLSAIFFWLLFLLYFRGMNARTSVHSCFNLPIFTLVHFYILFFIYFLY